MNTHDISVNLYLSLSYHLKQMIPKICSKRDIGELFFTIISKKMVHVLKDFFANYYSL